MSETTNLIFAGVGGQGVLLIAELTAQTAVRAGYDVKQTEVHGVSQRGGSVESHVRFGPEVYSPLVIAGQADVVIGLEKLEALRYANFVNQKTGTLLVNDYEIVPGSVAGAAEMNYRRFVTYNIVGGILWVFSMVLLGYFLGNAIPNINEHIHLVIAIVVFLSVLPAIIEVLRERRKKRKALLKDVQLEEE